MKVGGYNIMKQPTFQSMVKSTCVLVNGNKFFKWSQFWAVQVWTEELMNMVTKRWLMEVKKGYLDFC
jgi:hypothetical protein